MSLRADPKAQVVSGLTLHDSGSHQAILSTEVVHRQNSVQVSKATSALCPSLVNLRPLPLEALTSFTVPCVKPTPRHSQLALPACLPPHLIGLVILCGSDTLCQGSASPGVQHQSQQWTECRTSRQDPQPDKHQGSPNHWHGQKNPSAHQ